MEHNNNIYKYIFAYFWTLLARMLSLNNLLLVKNLVHIIFGGFVILVSKAS